MTRETRRYFGSRTEHCRSDSGRPMPPFRARRRRLPNRRPAINETIDMEGQRVEVSVGFDPETGAVREIFLVSGKEGSSLNSLLADAAVAISVALQHGVSPAALAKSVGRLPNGSVTPADLDRLQSDRRPISLIGGALDLLRSLDNGEVGET